MLFKSTFDLSVSVFGFFYVFFYTRNPSPFSTNVTVGVTGSKWFPSGLSMMVRYFDSMVRSGLPVVSQWYPICLPVVSQLSPSGLPVVSQWSPSAVPVVSQWSPSGLSQWSPSGLSVVQRSRRMFLICI